MREAENAIGKGQDGAAVDAQGRALEGLQRGMQGMAQQMQQMMQGDGTEQANGDPPGQPGNAQGRNQPGQRDNDPLGRPTRSRDFSDGRVKVPGADESASQRAQRILEELRRKLGDPLPPAGGARLFRAPAAPELRRPFPVTGPPEGASRLKVWTGSSTFWFPSPAALSRSCSRSASSTCSAAAAPTARSN